MPKLRLNENKIEWFNGKRWLAKETCVDKEDTKTHNDFAKKRLKELKKLKLDKNLIFFWNGKDWQLRERCFDQGPTKANVELAKKRLEELKAENGQ